MPWYLQHNMTSRSFHKMLPWEICVSSSLASYWEREANQIHGNSNFVQSILWKILKGNSALVFAITWYQCVHCLIFLYAYLAHYCFCAMLFSVFYFFSFNIFRCLHYVPGFFFFFFFFGSRSTPIFSIIFTMYTICTILLQGDTYA